VKILQIPFVAEFVVEKGAIIAIFASGAAGMGIEHVYNESRLIFFRFTADILIAGSLCYYLQFDQTDMHQA
jgi:hypothetical protein